jgi:glutamate synthase domain-containing protein 3
MVDLEPLLSESEQHAKVLRDLWHLGTADEAIARRLIESHARHTDSRRARELLADWTKHRARFVKVFPKEYRRALTENATAARKAVA